MSGDEETSSLLARLKSQVAEQEAVMTKLQQNAATATCEKADLTDAIECKLVALQESLKQSMSEASFYRDQCDELTNFLEGKVLDVYRTGIPLADETLSTRERHMLTRAAHVLRSQRQRLRNLPGSTEAISGVSRSTANPTDVSRLQLNWDVSFGPIEILSAECSLLKSSVDKLGRSLAPKCSMPRTEPESPASKMFSKVGSELFSHDNLVDKINSEVLECPSWKEKGQTTPSRRNSSSEGPHVQCLREKRALQDIVTELEKQVNSMTPDVEQLRSLETAVSLASLQLNSLVEKKVDEVHSLRNAMKPYCSHILNGEEYASERFFQEEDNDEGSSSGHIQQFFRKQDTQSSRHNVLHASVASLQKVLGEDGRMLQHLLPILETANISSVNMGKAVYSSRNRPRSGSPGTSTAVPVLSPSVETADLQEHALDQGNKTSQDVDGSKSDHPDCSSSLVVGSPCRMHSPLRRLQQEFPFTPPKLAASSSVEGLSVDREQNANSGSVLNSDIIADMEAGKLTSPQEKARSLKEIVDMLAPPECSLHWLLGAKLLELRTSLRDAIDDRIEVSRLTAQLDDHLNATVNDEHYVFDPKTWQTREEERMQLQGRIKALLMAKDDLIKKSDVFDQRISRLLSVLEIIQTSGEGLPVVDPTEQEQVEPP